MTDLSHIAADLHPLAVPVDGLRLLPGNPRRGDVDAVARSYDRFGQRKPIVARRDGTVIAGNHQLQAARQLGWSHMAVVWTDDDDLTAQAFALADNRTADLGTYDSEALLLMLNEVAVTPTLIEAASYTQADLDALLALSTPPDLDDLIADVGPPTDDDRLVNVTLRLSPELAEALRSEVRRIGSDEQAVALWLNL